MTLQQAYTYGKNRLTEAGIEDADTDAWLLLEYVTKISRATYFLEVNRGISREDEEKYKAYIEKRVSHIPLQHITGTQEFMGMEFYVNEHVLVPRQDTEVLVEEVQKVLETGMDVLDMCTGSGCIAISLAKSGKEANVHGIDISTQALELAEKNCKKLEADVNLIQSDLFEKVDGKYDIIVSNPPYICTSEIEKLKEEVKCHDPYIALDGKEDGLYFYRKIVASSGQYLKENGRLYFEIGYDQADAVKLLMEDAGFTQIAVKKDLAGLDRVVFGIYNK